MPGRDGRSRNTGASSPAILDCSYNKGNLAQLNVTGCTSLRVINCMNGGLTGTLDLSSCPILTSVYANDNKLSEIIVPDVKKLPREFKFDKGVIIRQPDGVRKALP